MRYPLVLVAALRPHLALASLYPTYPVANSVLERGARATCTWIDTYHHPGLAEIGLLDIHLCDVDGVTCVRLAHQVSPMSRAHTVDIPQNPLCLDRCVMILQTNHPPMKYWTSNFPTISSLNDTTVPYKPQQDALLNATAHELTLVLPTTTIVTEIAEATKAPAATTIEAGPPPKDGGGGVNLNHVFSPSAANRRKGSELLHARIRVLIFAGPALVGISLAL